MNGNTAAGAFTIDGAVATTTVPNPDTISEFKIQTSQYDAGYGTRVPSVNLVTRTGENDFHGDAWEFLRNDIFNANTYINNARNIKRPPLRYNNYGYTIGGPVGIPGLWTQKEPKTFFFWSQEWRRDRVPASFNTVVPYSAERSGDFSDLCPNPTVQAPDDPFADCPIDPLTGTHFDGSLGPLPVDPAAAALLPLIPVGTVDVPGASSYITNTTLPTTWRDVVTATDVRHGDPAAVAAELGLNRRQERAIRNRARAFLRERLANRIRRGRR